MPTRRDTQIASFAGLVATPALAGEMPAPAILRRAVAEGVSAAEVAESLKLRAQKLNFRLVAEMPLSQQVAASTGLPQRLTTIFQFCDPVTALSLVLANMDFVAWMPCRIALVEDADARLWLVMASPDPLIALVPPPLLPQAQKVRASLMDIFQAGAIGDL